MVFVVVRMICCWNDFCCCPWNDFVIVAAADVGMNFVFVLAEVEMILLLLLLE